MNLQLLPPNRIPHFAAAFTLLCTLATTGLQAQNRIPAQILLQDQNILKGEVGPRRPGTTVVQFFREEGKGQLTLNLSEVGKIHFNLEEFNLFDLRQQFQIGNYTQVIDALKGKVIPFFQFVDQDANSNELVSLFIRSLYRQGNYPGVHAAAGEVAKFAAAGDIRRMADIYRALSLLQTGDLEGYKAYQPLFDQVKIQDPMAPALWYGQAKLALIRDRWEEAYPPLSKIITEAPMATEWSGEALFLTAQYHFNHTNLVVANQICQELRIVAPLGPWAAKAEELQKKIQPLAEEMEVTLMEFGMARARKREAGDAAVDYRERQKALEDLAAEEPEDEATGF